MTVVMAVLCLGLTVHHCMVMAGLTLATSVRTVSPVLRSGAVTTLDMFTITAG